MKVGVQLAQQHADIDELRRAWREADEALDSIWVWDHFFPLSGEPDGKHFECWTLLAAIAADTSRATIGPLVTACAFRNPHLVADMARTIDHLSGGRFILGLGAGWFKRDYTDYGYPFGTARTRVRDLAAAIPVVRERLDQLVPPPVGRVPLLVGGGGERVLLPLAARVADIWNCIENPETFARKSRLLDEECRRIGREPAEIERTVAAGIEDLPRWREFEQAGAEHFIVGLVPPYDIAAVAEVAEQAHARNAAG
jgi:probable F420-dependent oxidoreductase